MKCANCGQPIRKADVGHPNHWMHVKRPTRRCPDARPAGTS